MLGRKVLGAKGGRGWQLTRLRHSGRLPGVSGKLGSEVWSEPGDKGRGRVLQVERTDCTKARRSRTCSQPGDKAETCILSPVLGSTDQRDRMSPFLHLTLQSKDTAVFQTGGIVPLIVGQINLVGHDLHF